MPSSPFAFIWLAGFVVCNAAVVPTTGRADETLYEGHLGEDGARLVVTRGADIDPSVFDFLKTRRVSQVRSISEIRAAIQRKGMPPVLVGTMLHCEYKLPLSPEQPFTVFDSIVTENDVILAVADSTYLAVWRFSLLSQPPVMASWMPLRGSWNDYALLYPLNHDVVEMKLGRTGDGRISAEVTDKRRPGAPHKHTLFEQQDKEKLELTRVRQWEEAPQGGSGKPTNH